jgi:hypothetical protein
MENGDMKSELLQGNRTRHIRTACGAYMVETLVALLLGTMFAFVLLQMFSETMRLTSSSGNRQTADFIVQTVLDSVKRTDPDKWEVGSYPLLVNSSSAGERGALVHPLPVGLNAGDLNWTAKSKGSGFKGTVALHIQSGNVTGSKVAVVTAIWSDSSNVVSKKSATLTSVYAKGVNYWP